MVANELGGGGAGASFFGVWRTFDQWEVAVVKTS